MALCHLGLGVGVGFLRPLAQEFLGQLPHLGAHAFLGFISGAVVGDGLIQRVGQFMQAGQHVGPMRQPLFQRQANSGNKFGMDGFIVHEPLQIYKILPRSQG